MVLAIDEQGDTHSDIAMDARRQRLPGLLLVPSAEFSVVSHETMFGLAGRPGDVYIDGGGVVRRAILDTQDAGTIVRAVRAMATG